MTTKLGKLERVDLRKVWETEDQHFTPWLGRDENIALLAEALNLEELTVEAQEKNVGPFRADILCKDETENWVLIENQLEKTDHKHLGQLLTYAAGLNAVTVIWIADKFNEEHRAALDWLNDMTDDSINFFGLEVELWRIGESPLAPKFNIVSKPNDWSQTIRGVRRDIESANLSPGKLSQQKFWSAFRAYLLDTNHPLRPRKALPQHWMSFAAGRSGFRFAALQSIRDNWIGVEFVCDGRYAKPHYYLLEKNKEEIEADLGYPITWLELPNAKRSRVEIKNLDLLRFFINKFIFI